MRIRLLSDLHLEFTSTSPAAAIPAPEGPVDVTVLAGDICTASPAQRERYQAIISHVSQQTGSPTLLVAGNHEYYGTSLDAANELLASLDDVIVLNRDQIVIDGVRFLGCPLWPTLVPPPEVDPDLFEFQLQRSLSDFRRIEQHPGRPLSPASMRELGAADAAWLAAALAEPFVGPSVVITHWLPHWACVAPQFRGNLLNHYFVAEAAIPLVESGLATWWLHGHTHATVDETIAGTRVLANPHGYPHLAAPENPGFTWSPSFELGR